MRTIFFVDREPERGQALADMIRKEGIPVVNFNSLRETVKSLDPSQKTTIIAHADFLSGSFTDMAMLIYNSDVDLVFFCTEARDRSKELQLLPDDFPAFLRRLREFDPQ